MTPETPAGSAGRSTTGAFGQRVRQLRKAAGLSQRELAHRIDRDFTYISKVENGHALPFSAPTILRLADVLNADPEDLLTLGDKPPVSALRRRLMSLEERLHGEIAIQRKYAAALEQEQRRTMRLSASLYKHDALAARLVAWYDTHMDPAQPMDAHAACELRALVDEARAATQAVEG